MKTLKRLAIGQLNDLEKLSMNEQKNIIGGYGGEGNCFFNCLEFLNQKYGCHEGWTYENYANDYVNGQGNLYDDWMGTNTDEGLDVGPGFVNFEENWLNNQPFEYMAHCFNTEGSQWTLSGSNVAGFFGSPSDGSDNPTIVGTYLVGEPGSGVVHCVIFTGYDSSTGLFNYFDPTTGSSGTIEEEKVICGAQVNGCK